MLHVLRGTGPLEAARVRPASQKTEIRPVQSMTILTPSIVASLPCQ